MKKGLKIAGAIAALAALVPYSVNKNEETREVTAYALLWKLTSRPAPGEEGGRSVTVDFGFHDPRKESDPCDCDTGETVSEPVEPADDEADLFEDDASWCGSPAAAEPADPEDSAPV